MDATSPLKIYVFHRSYFCGKMLAYLRYKGIAHTPVYQSLADVGEKISANTGLRQMPVIELPDGRWMHDTTPMIEWFESQTSDRAVLSGDPVTDFFIRLLEDYADEWMWRPAILSRWESKADRQMYMRLFAREFLGGFWARNSLTTWIAGHLIYRHQRQKFLNGDGVTRANRDYVWSVYTNTLDRLQAIFERQPYLLGDKPCMADFAFHGSMFWHFGNDPTPNRIMQNRAPAVYEWVGRLWNAGASYTPDADFANQPGKAPLMWTELLEDVSAAYLPYLQANAEAFAQGRTRFDFSVQGVDYPNVHVSPYRVWCLENLQRHLASLTPAQRDEVRGVLEPLTGWKPLTAPIARESDWDPQGAAPFCTPGKIPLAWTLKARFTGTNHVSSRRAWD